MSVRLTAPSIAKASTAVDRGESLDMFGSQLCDRMLVEVEPMRFERFAVSRPLSSCIFVVLWRSTLLRCDYPAVLMKPQ